MGFSIQIEVCTTIQTVIQSAVQTAIQSAIQTAIHSVWQTAIQPSTNKDCNTELQPFIWDLAKPLRRCNGKKGVVLGLTLFI